MKSYDNNPQLLINDVDETNSIQIQSFVSVVWYTAMVGKKSSLKAVLKLLRAEEIRNVRTTRFDPVRTSLL
jgi:hypothetical protein